LNANTVTLISGTIGGTYVQFGADLASVLDDGNKLRVLPIVGRGSVQSVADVLFLQGVDLGIVRSDTLDYLEKKGFAKDIKKQFAYVTKLYNEEMHVIAPKSIRSLKDLEGKKVSVDLPNGGTFVTAAIVFERLGIRPNFLYIEQRIAMEKLRTGQIDAVIAVVIGDIVRHECVIGARVDIDPGVFVGVGDVANDGVARRYIVDAVGIALILVSIVIRGVPGNQHAGRGSGEVDAVG